MKNTSSKVLLMLGCGCLTAISNLSAANIVVNGSFESGTTAWNQNNLNSAVETSRGSITGAQDGSNFMIGTQDGSFYFRQTLITEINTEYSLSFYLARPQTNNNDFSYTVDVFDGAASSGNGDLLDVDIINGEVASAGTWVEFTYNFTALSTQSSLRFGDLGTTGVDPAIDNISVNAVVPEPSSSLLLMGAYVAMAFRRRRMPSG